MKLTRHALRREVKVLETRARLDSQTIASLRDQLADACARINSLQMEVDALRAEPRAAAPALADNVRLAHQLERAEHLQHLAEQERDSVMARLMTITARHPHLLAADELETP